MKNMSKNKESKIEGVRYTTSELKRNQHLINDVNHKHIYERHCIGFTNNKRDTSLDGYYLPTKLIIKLRKP